MALLAIGTMGLFGFLTVTMILDHIETTDGKYLREIIQEVRRWKEQPTKKRRSC